jgi:conjugal transfer pilus assembly protein TrbC
MLSRLQLIPSLSFSPKEKGQTSPLFLGATAKPPKTLKLLVFFFIYPLVVLSSAFGQMPSDSKVIEQIQKDKSLREKVFNISTPSLFAPNPSIKPSYAPNVLVRPSHAPAPIQPAKKPLSVEDIAKSFKTPKIDVGSNAIFFVSFSMPESSLKRIASEAKKIKARLVINGLYQDDWKSTQIKIGSIFGETGVFEIDPRLFNQFKINSVPALVLHDEVADFARDEAGCTLPKHFVSVFGDVSAFVLLDEILKNSPSFSDSAALLYSVLGK